MTSLRATSPYISECRDIRETIELFSCNGEPVEYDSVFYDVGHFEELSFTSVAGCDSIIGNICATLTST